MTDAKWWDFTIPEKEVLSEEGLQTMLDELCEKWCYGHEIGKQTGYEHIQGRVVFKTGKELATIRNQTEVVLPKAHWTKTHVRNFEYCEKDGAFVRSWEKVLRKFATIELRYWQEQALSFYKTQSERGIYVVVDMDGNHGKSVLSKHIEASHMGDVCPVTDGDASNYLEYCCKHPAKGYVFDVPKADSIKTKKAMWRAIEQIKNGLLYDRRYTSEKKWIDPPKIIVFTNEWPPIQWLSEDRWTIHQVRDYPITGTELVPCTLDEVRAWASVEQSPPSPPQGGE